MQFMRLKNGLSHRGPIDTYENANPRAALATVLDIIGKLMDAGPDLTVLRVIHEVNKWEVVGPDADKEYAKLDT